MNKIEYVAQLHIAKLDLLQKYMDLYYIPQLMRPPQFRDKVIYLFPVWLYNLQHDPNFMKKLFESEQAYLRAMATLIYGEDIVNGNIGGLQFDVNIVDKL